jgi:hypothetical protein
VRHDGNHAKRACHPEPRRTQATPLDQLIDRDSRGRVDDDFRVHVEQRSQAIERDAETVLARCVGNTFQRADERTASGSSAEDGHARLVRV